MMNQIHVPQLDEKSKKANPNLAKAFTSYLQDVIAHELLHFKHGVMACKNVRELMETASQSHNTACLLTNEQLDEIFSASFNSSSSMDISYDSVTNHGETQGACFGIGCADEKQVERFNLGNIIPASH